MIGYRRNSFKKATEFLSSIRVNLADLESLRLIQEVLIFEITLAEQRIRENRKKQNAKADASDQRYVERSKSLRTSIYYWKLFGDAIAFMYCDRFALKATYYNLHNLAAKQDGGFISGSEGLEAEVACLRAAIARGIPVLLCDLTNTIRYGDICLLVQNDPRLIEIKSSGTRDRRSVRQKRRLKKLAEFYDADKLAGFRGFPLVERAALRTTIVSYEKEFNQCISDAYDQGYASISPEPGVQYIALMASNGGRISEIFGQISFSEPWLFNLNEVKANSAWTPYRPFTLLIESGPALYDFVLGRLFLLVVLDVGAIKDCARSMGYIPEFIPESDYPLRVRKRKAEEERRIAKHLLLRAALEAVSLKWIVQEGLTGLQEEPNRTGLPLRP